VRCTRLLTILNWQEIALLQRNFLRFIDWKLKSLESVGNSVFY